MSEHQLSNLRVLNPSGRCLSQPTLAVLVYSSLVVHDLAPLIAQAIEKYLAFVGSDVLKTYASTNGSKRPLTAKRIARDMQRMRNMPASMSAEIVEYDSDPGGYIGEYGVYFHATDLTDPELERFRSNFLRLDFPPTFLAQRGLDTFLSFVAETLGALPFESASCGYAFRRGSAVSHIVVRQLRPYLARYQAIDPGYLGVMDDFRGKVLSAHWIDALGTLLVQKLDASGGASSMPADVKITSLANGIMLRSAKVPPIGDVNAGSRDVGALPNVARWLRPIRLTHVAFGEPNFDGPAWLKRFDDMQPRAWDNA